MIAIEVVLIPCLGCNHTVCRSLILQVCRIAERYECRGTVAPKVHVTLCERVLVTVGSQIITVVTVLCLGVFVAVGILYGCGGNIALRVVVGYIVVLNSLSVNRIAILRVEVLGDDLTETEELSSLTLLNEMTGTSDGANGSMTEGYIYLFNDPLKEGKGWLEKYYLYQVPLEEIALNPNLTQNPGWE
jgi:hypothetical protein